MLEDTTERIIEDILSADRSILAELIGVQASSLSLVARQKDLASGKLDLLLLHDDVLLLVELKAVNFYPGIIRQISDYYRDLCDLQVQHRLINTDIERIVLVTGSTDDDRRTCEANSIRLVTYQPSQVLVRYYENFREMSAFLTIQSGDYGVVRLGLLKPTLGSLSQGRSCAEIASSEGRSPKTIGNRLSVATQLGLVAKTRGEWYLTEFGTSFLAADEPGPFFDRLNARQSALLADYVSENPFQSSISYTILALVECVFTLAKSAHPVSENRLREFFVASVGKGDTWKAPRARETATYIFANYACDLGFLTKINNEFYITPSGIRSILLLQLNRSILLIRSQR